MIELRNISKTYDTGSVGVHALRDVSLTINAGEFVAIMGASGSGKSTLMHILGLLDRPDTGSYFLNGRDVSHCSDDECAEIRNTMAGFVFQQFHLLQKMSAVQNVELPLIYAGKRHLKDKAVARLDDVGLGARKEHRPNQLSGGEQQRVAIARALVNEPCILFADEPTGNLDTKSEEEIMAVLKQLHASGKTIVMVTHEREVAEHAQRIIVMRDGMIISDEKKSVEHGEGTVSSTDKPLPSAACHHATFTGVSFLDHIRMAVYATIAHKLRSFLSMLGILIGVGAVIAMLALGQGAKESISKSLSSLGSNLLTVRPGSEHMHGVALEAGAVTRFTIQDADALAKLSGIKSVSPSVSGKVQAVYGNKNWSTQVQGTGVSYETMRTATPTFGRFFTDEEVRVRKRVALIGATVARELFGTAYPIGATIKLNRTQFVVIGVLPEKGATGWRDQDDVIVIPITTAMYRVLGKEYIDSIDAEVQDPALIDAAQDAISEAIIKRHHIPKEKEEDAFQIRNMADIQKTLEATTKTMTLLLGSIAAISLLVGGIGIMNIMLVSVTERTKEIGLRKAIGARRKDIMLQFLIESVFLTSLGGLVGIAFGSGIAWALAAFVGWTTKISLFSVCLATIFSVAVGIGFGLWPARHAARLNPIEALRYE